jgi:predicted ATPase
MRQFERFGLDTANQCLLHNGAAIEMAPKPFAVLRYMVENPGRLITHDELLDALWPETYVQPQVLRTYVLELRKVLGDDAGQPRFIQTLPKRGYRFVAPVTERNGIQPGPVMGLAGPDSGPEKEIVGRDEELHHLHQQLHNLAGGQRRTVFVTGETGIGKTALVDTFCHHLAPSMAASVARGQCVQGVGGKEEYYPVTEALAQLCAGPHGDAACRILARMAPAWLASGHSAPATSSEPRPANAERSPNPERVSMPNRTLGDLCGALEELAAEKPLILVFEDLHWADDSTLNLISVLARRRGHAKLMVLATFCPFNGAFFPVPTEVTPEHLDPDRLSLDRLKLDSLKQDLLMRRLCTEIELPPLRKAAVKALLSRELSQEELPPGLADFVHLRSEGNPLFVTAILEHLIAQSYLARVAAGQWEQRAPFQEMEASIPDQLARMIEFEIGRLCEDDQRLLEAGSLMSVAFPAWAVAAALQKDPIEIEEACDALARRVHFVVRAGQDELPDGSRSAFYVLAHGLYREVLYRRQAEARRARRHIRIAERLGELFPGREAAVARERAMHYEAAGNRERAASVLDAAAIPVLQAGIC